MAQQSRFTAQGFQSWRDEHIAQIDLAIDRIHRKLRRLETIDPMSAESWQNAWDRHPDLHQQEHDLYRLRGIAQIA